jgi:MFS family permease
VLVAVWGFFAIFVLMTSLDSVLPLYVGKIFGWKQACQGLIFLPLAIPHIAEPMVGFINDKYRCVRSYAGAGGFLLSVPVLVLLRIVTYNSLGQKILLCALLSLVGLCIAILMPSFLAEVSYIVQNKEEETPGIFGEGGAMALAYGIMNVACAAGGIAGPFLGGLLREHAGWGVMTWALAVLVGITAILVLLLPARDSFKRRHADG